MSLAVVALGDVLAAPALAVSLPPVVATVGTALPPTPTVALTGLVAPIQLSISPPLPPGLTFDAGTVLVAGSGVIAGTPTVASASTVYTVTATDSTAVTPVIVTADIAIAIHGLLTAPAPVTATLGHPLTGNPSFTVLGLGTPVSYAAPTAPAWLHISETGVLSGTPDAVLPTAMFDVTATDPAGAVAIGSLSLAVVSALDPAVQTVTGKVGTAVTPTLAFPALVDTTFAIIPDVTPLTGLSFSTATGVVSGRPTHLIAPASFTVQRVSTVDGSILAEAEINVTVEGVLATSPLPIAGTVGTAIVAFVGYGPTVASAVGLVAPLTYGTTPDLPGIATPGDLVIDPATGTISGRPEAASAGTSYMVTVVDSKGAKASGPVIVTVAGLVLPATQTIIGAVSSTMITKVLAPSGMASPVSYAISPAPQLGLLFNASTGVISGIPRTTQATTRYDIVATDANGATGTTSLTLTVGKALLSPPIIGSVIGGSTPGSLRVFFTGPMRAPIDQEYTVEVFDSTGVDLLTSIDTLTSPADVVGLVPGETYQVVVVAKASTLFDSVESAPKLGVAAQEGVGSSLASPTHAAGVEAISAMANAALLKAGIIVVTGVKGLAAKQVVVKRGPTRAISRAPAVRIPVGTFTRIVVPGINSAALLEIRIRANGAWLALGRARANARHLLKLPAFAATRVGTYPILIAAPTGQPVYVRLIVR